MTTRELANQLTELSDSVRAAFQLISRLSKLTFSGDRDSEVRVELAQDIHEGLKQHEETFELLKQEFDDLTTTHGRHSRRDSERDSERARLAALTARLGEDLKHARSQFRRAQLRAKKASESAKAAEREALFTSLRTTDINTPPTAGSTDLFAGRRATQKQQTQNELIINASNDVTLALRQTNDRLSAEVTRSRFAAETLQQSEDDLKGLSDKYTDLDTLLSNSRNLLGTLVKSQKSDTWYLETAFYILVITLTWLIFRRLIYGPAWWFLWLPLKYFLFKPFAFIFSAFGIRAAATTTSLQASTSTRPPLRIQPSASGGIPKFKDAKPGMGPAIPAGGGGAGAKVPPREQKLSDRIGEMAEQSRQEQQLGAARSGEQKDEPLKRADGTVLQPRGDKPQNPKKKMFEADVEDQKYEEMRARDEL